MWKLPPPDIGSAEFDARLAFEIEKYAADEDEILELLELYAKYSAAIGRPSDDFEDPALDDEMLTALYESFGLTRERGPLGHLREMLRASVLHCPYCGFGDTRELDHHLPRGRFRAFSIYAMNLIPCCATCNKKKSTVAEEDENHQFSHTYLDTFPTARFLVASVDLPTGGGIVVEFSIQKRPQIPDDLHARLRFQFSRLGLNERLQPEVTTHLSTLRVGIEDAAIAGAETLRDHLSRTAQRHAVDFGLNDWRTALVEALSTSQPFCSGGYTRCFGRPMAVGA